MKLTALLLTIAFMHANASGSAQTVTLSGKDLSLKQVFAAIKQQTGYVVFGSTAFLRSGTTVNVAVRDMPLKDFLEVILKDLSVNYTMTDKTISLSPKINTIFYELTDTIGPLVNVKGSIRDGNGQPVPGVSIAVKGKRTATSASDNGLFSIQAAVGDILMFTSIGFAPHSATIRNAGPIDVILMRSESKLDEVVFKGYYTTSKRFNTGSVSTVRAEEIERQPISNPLQAIQGRMTGVQVIQQTGVSGGAFKIQIRGRNSLRNSQNDNGNLPLYVIDGVPFSSTSYNSPYLSHTIQGGSPLSVINPSDIQSIEVLKDADATAIYGSRGANGVVLITTKRNTGAKTNFEINASAGAGKVARMLEMLNTEQYLEMRNEAFKNDGTTPDEIYDYDVNGTWPKDRYTDWQKVLVGGSAKQQNVQARMYGGTDRTHFMLGGGFFKESPVFSDNFANRKTSLHFSLDHVSKDSRFRYGLVSSYTIEKNGVPSLDLTYPALNLPPNAPALYNEDGSLNWDSSRWQNPVANLLKTYENNTRNLLANLSLSYELMKNLRLKSTFGYTSLEIDETGKNPLSSIDPRNIYARPSAVYGTGRGKTWIIEPQLDYTFVSGNNRITVLAGTTFQESIKSGETMEGYDYASDALLDNIHAAAQVASVAKSYLQYKYNAVFGRVNYTYDDKYLLNLTGRRDGSSRFGPGRQFANFGAVGAAWIFSNEPFVLQRLPFISFGKLKTSYGITGSDQIPDYDFLNSYTPTTNPYSGTGLLVTRHYNPDYSWESTTKFEVGMELGLFNDKLFVEAGWYRNRSSNQLVQYPLTLVTGQSGIRTNFPATVQNTGLELAVNADVVKTNRFSWHVSANLTIPRNKLAAYQDLALSAYAHTYVIGKPLGIVNGFRSLGVDPQTGLYTFEDYNKNGVTYWDYPGDLQPLNANMQFYFGGVQQSFAWNGIELQFLLQFVKQTGLNYKTFFNPPGTSSNQPALVMKRWQRPGDRTTVQKFSQTYGTEATTAFYNHVFYSDEKLGDASFIRLKNISLAYDLQGRWLRKIHIQRCKLFAQAQNLLTFTAYEGLDPENQFGQGLGPLKMITGGIQIVL